jgi:hypothetical protein
MIHFTMNEKTQSVSDRLSFLNCRRAAAFTLGIFFCILTSTACCVALAVDNESYISTEKGAGNFPLSTAGTSAPLVASAADYPGVLLVLRDLQADIGRVSDATPPISIDSLPSGSQIVLVGTIGKNSLIDRLVRDKKLDVEGIAGKWETFLIQTVDHPFPGIAEALVIAGSDKRGTLYGMYNLSSNIGVSPWYWWADVPVKKQRNIFVLPGRHSLGEPKVKYRGIFINDEEPSLGGWVREKFGGFNSKFYVHVFKLMLRLKANYLWPAMWNSSFDTDDTLNPRLADEYGIVMGTSHHEPMMRAWKEWERAGNKQGSWDYSKNADSLRRYWAEGIRRTENYENIVTVGMRGDGDEPMSQGENIALLQKIVTDQRKILGEVTGKDVTTIPQVWALYKEVQEYYDKGMRVPDDVTLLLCDDNWGNIRRLPKLADRPRAGGYGIYYHFDYVGGPRNYKWLNTNQISRVWEQMHLAYEYGAKRIWIVNVGDIKPMEFPISFFLDYAWNPDRWPASSLPEYTRLWAEQQFGSTYAKDIAEILTKYTKYNARRKPELLSPTTYSLTDYREAETVVADYNNLAKEAQRISDALPQEYKDAFYQLVLYPVLACSNLNDLYVTVGKNWLYAKQGRAATDSLARTATEFFKKDSLLSYYYNKVMAHGKWDHMMDQTHIGYTYWQQPDYNAMPEVKEIALPDIAEMGVAIQGSDTWWPEESGDAVLPGFDPYNRQTYYIDVFNRGRIPFSFSASAGEQWVTVSPENGTIETQERLWIAVDWTKVAPGKYRIPITISGPEGRRVVVYAIVNYPKRPERKDVRGFIESNGYISIEAEHYGKAVEERPVTWLRIPDLGRTLSAMTPMPVTAPRQSPGGKSPHLEYDTYFFSTGEVTVNAYVSPTLDFLGNGGPCYAVSFDDEPPQIVSLHKDDTEPDWKYPEWWNQAVSENIIIKATTLSIRKAGEHVLKFWMVDPAVDLQKLVIESGQVKPSYLGPPESFHQGMKMYGEE